LVELIAPWCPDNCLLVGWSLGGLVASRLAMSYPHKVATLCLLASTPCFVEQPQWKGIKPQVLDAFSASLGQDSDKTIERFLAIQAMGSATARNDIKWLRKAVLQHGGADLKALSGGLTILQQVDLRAQLAQLTLPITGIYGRLDALVAVKSITQLAPTLQQFDFRVIDKASHAPFISHPQQFIDTFMGLHQPFLRD
jgi:pimeloyl-[acyl-carrier protein] methyl ester esterase